MPVGSRRSIVLFIGDAMGAAYRDAARLVSRSIVDANGRNSFREGFFDNLLEMDEMPVSGMSMTYGTDAIVPDSANTGAACHWKQDLHRRGEQPHRRYRLPVAIQRQTNATTLPFMLDNPRVENLWQ